MADSKRESRVVKPIVHTADGKFEVGCGNDTCYCTGECEEQDREEVAFRKRINNISEETSDKLKELTKQADSLGTSSEESSKEASEGLSELSIKVTADVNEAITGFKALSRELREATKAARELEQAYSSAAEAYKDVEKAKDLQEGNVIIDGKKVAKAVYATDFSLSTHRDLSEVPTEVLHEELSKRKREGLK